MDVVDTTGLTKTYGTATVVRDLDLRVPEGSVYGLLGPNGSGKTTTMKMVLSLARPSRGQVLLFGEEMTRASRHRLLRRVGSLIESPPGYGHLTGAENMRLVQRLLRVEDSAVDRAVRAVRMTGQLDKRVRDYSLGMKQRLGIAMALVQDPRLLVLDEPTNGLDPAGIEEMRDLIVSLARDEGRTVVVSSHLLSEIERMATVLGILHHGELLFQGTMAQLFDRQRPDVLVRTPLAARAAEAVADLDPVGVDGGVRLFGLAEADVAAAAARLVAADVPIWEIRREQRSLEDVFIGLTGREALA